MNTSQQHYEIVMNANSLQRPPSGDTSSLRQIPETCSRALSPETIERLREGRKLKNRNGDRTFFTEALAQACKELGIASPYTISRTSGKRQIKQSSWNCAIAAIDEACPDWRGYTVEVDHDVFKWVAA